MKNRVCFVLLPFFLLAFLILPTTTSAQLSLTTSGAPVTIDFDNTLSGVNNGLFAGSGFQPSPGAGQLNSNAWAMTGWSDGSLAFGGTQNSGDFARGSVTAAVGTGGVHALNDGGNRRFLIQPAASDWAPGTLTLRIQNNMGSPLRQIDIAYDLFVRDDQNRANSFNFSYSTDDASYTSVSSMDYTSPATATNTFFLVAGSSPSRRIRIAGLDIPDGGFFYVRWSGNDVGGSGNRDEFALDNIAVTGFNNNLIAAGSYPTLLVVGNPPGDKPTLEADISTDSLGIDFAGALDANTLQISSISGIKNAVIRGRFETSRETGLSGAFNSLSIALDSLSTIRFYAPASGSPIVQGRTDYGNVEIAGSGTKTLAGPVVLFRGSLILESSTLNVSNDSVVFRSGNTPIIRNGITQTGQIELGGTTALQFGDNISQLGAAFTIPNGAFSVTILRRLIINRTNPIILNQSLSPQFLTLTRGQFWSSGGGGSGSITVTSTATDAIEGGSTTAFVRGDLLRNFQNDISTDGTSYFFPIGDSLGTYRPTTLLNVRTSSGTTRVSVRAFESGSATFNASLLSVRPPYWFISEVTAPNDLISATLQLSGTSLVDGENVVAVADASIGAYSSIGGSVSGSSVTSNTQAFTLNASRERYAAIGAFAAEPTLQATAISFASVTASTFTINFTVGNGTNRLVVMRRGNPVTFTPVDGTNYTGSINSVFSLAANQDADSNRIVFAGTGSSVNVSGLSGNTTYHVAIYEFNGTLSNNSANFLITAPPTASQTTVPNQPTQNVNTLVFSNFQTNALTLSWNVPSGDVGANRVVVARLFSTTAVPPTDFVTYTPNSNFGSGDPTGTDNFVVFNGNAPNDITITGLSQSTRYAFDIYEYNGSGSTANYNPSGVSANRFTLKLEPPGGVNSLLASGITKTSVKLDWNLDTPVTPPDSVIIFRRIGVAVPFEPIDGRAYSVGELDPTGWRVLTKLGGATTTFNATNLSSGTSYQFRIYAFNQDAASAQTANYRTSSGVAENNATTLSGQVYEWNAGDGLWVATSNWNPNGVPSDGDLAQFNNGGTYTVSNVPTTSIGAIEVDNNTQVTFTTGTPAKTITLTGFGSGAGNGLNVNSGTLTLDVPSAITLSIQSGNTGRIADSVVVSFNGSRVTSPDSAGIIVEIGGVVRANSGVGGLFGTAGTTSSVIFESGATYVHNSSGANPFQTTAGIARFLSGSNYRQFTNSGFAASGRTFGNLEFNLTGTLSPTGANPMTINGTLTKNGTGTVNLNLTGGINITGNIVSNAGTLTFNPVSASTITFNGTSAQEISAGSGTLTFDANASVTLNNAAGLTLQRSITLQNTLTLTSGLLTTNGNLTLAASASVTGGNDNSYVVGSLSHIFNTTLTTRVYPFGSSGRYRPISIRGNTSSGTATMSGALFGQNANLRESITDPPNRVSLFRHYGFQVTGTSIAIDQVPLLRANVDDGVGSFLSNSSLSIAIARTGSGWTLRNLESSPNTTLFPIDLIGETGLSFDAPIAPDSVLIALGSSSNTDNPLPVELLSYTGESTSEGAMLQWNTASEIDNLGFTILKDGIEFASFSNTPSLRGRGTTTEETRYQFVDSQVKVGDVHRYQLRQTDLNGTVHNLGTVTINITTAVAPREYSLSQNYPNPFNPTTVISYSLKASGDVKLELFDVLGRKVATLVNARQEAGAYTYPLNTTRFGLSTGMYFYRLQSSGFVATKKMLLVK